LYRRRITDWAAEQRGRGEHEGESAEERA
jgi:hypothetical protein